MKSNLHPSILFAVAVTTLVSIFPADAETGPPDLPNCHQVDSRIYRGGQPTDAGFSILSKNGIRTIIDLRPNGDEGTHSIKKESDAVDGAGMRYISIPLSGVSAPPPESVAKILFLANEAEGPVFIHCRRGSDCTGAIVACYRIEHDHWKRSDALQEAEKLGMRWLEFGMKRFVSTYQPEPMIAPSVPAFGAVPSTPPSLQ